MSKSRLIGASFLLVAVLLLSACCSSCKPKPLTQPQPPTPCQVAYDKLQWLGMTVIQTGDQVKMILPADHFFAPKSTALKPMSYLSLDQVALVLQCYRKVDVKIAGYTDSCGDPIVNRSLSEQQAKKIADYLWHQGVDTRILFPYGYGASNPIASNTTQKGRAQNRRIEITFTKITYPML